MTGTAVESFYDQIVGFVRCGEDFEATAAEIKRLEAQGLAVGRKAPKADKKETHKTE